MYSKCLQMYMTVMPIINTLDTVGIYNFVCVVRRLHLSEYK